MMLRYSAALLLVCAATLFPQTKKVAIKPGKAVVSPISSSSSNKAFDKAKLEVYLRHLNLWTPDIAVAVSDPQPSDELPGFQSVAVRASLGERFAEQKYLVNKDQTRILRADVYDLSANPFAKDISLINNGGNPSLGTTGAPVVVALFTDFQCPYCRDEAKIIRENLIASYPKQVRLYFHDFPLEQIHPWAKPAAIAGRCIHTQGEEGFWKFHDWIFEQQQTLNEGNLRQQIMVWAPPNGIDILQLTRCYDNKETLAAVDRDLEIAKKLGLNSTPTIYINGRKLAGSVDWAALKRVIDFELKYQETAKNAGDTACCSVSLKGPGAN